MKLWYHAAAEIELRAAARYYESRVPGLGVEFTQAIEQQCGLILERPDVGARYDRVHRRVFLRRFPFVLIYRVDKRRVAVVAVAHVRRRPGYWRTRS